MLWLWHAMLIKLLFVDNDKALKQWCAWPTGLMLPAACISASSCLLMGWKWSTRCLFWWHTGVYFNMVWYILELSQTSK